MDFSQPFKTLIPTLDGPVLRALAASQGVMSRPQILRLAGAGSEAGVRKVLNRLVEQGIVIEEHIGSYYTYRANREHIVWPAVDIVMEAHDALDRRIRDSVADWEVQPISVEMFGSVATGKSTSASDIDLIVVSPFLAEAQEERWDQQVDELRDGVRRWTGNTCEILVLDPSEVAAASANGDPTLASPRLSVVGDRIDTMVPTKEIARDRAP